MCSMMQIPQQQDSSSCGIIMLHLCANMISFAERCNYDVSMLKNLKASDLSIDDIIRTTKEYRLHLGKLLQSIFHCAISWCSHEDEGNFESSIVCT